MRFDRPLAHDVLIERLFAAAADGRLPHAILFEGPEGIGKFVAARWLAAGLLCERGPAAPCGECGPCKRVATENHPDLLLIDPIAEGEERIRVGRIAMRSDGGAGEEPERSLEAFLDLRAVEGVHRIVLIRECDRMNDAAQNALLKTLEEPRPGTLLVLETHRTSRLLPTILSRCIRVRFDALSRADCERVLKADDPSRPAERAVALARWADGSPGAALAFERRGGVVLRDLLGQCVRGERAPLAVAAAFWDVEGEFTGKTPTARARGRARFLVDLALAVWRDGMRLSSGVPQSELAHGDLAADVARSGVLGAARAFDRLTECRADIERNLAPEAVVERALLALTDRGRILRASKSGARG